MASHTILITVEDIPCQCIDLETLIIVKKAAGRKKGLEAIDELQALLEERQRRED